MFPSDRIVCLTEETVETLYLLGEQDRIVDGGAKTAKRICGTVRSDRKGPFLCRF
jgi:hypothetical protein